MNPRTTRRHFLAGLAAITTLAACGSSDEYRADAAVTGADGDGANGDFPRTIRTALGEVHIERPPERILALGNEGEAALALGVVPVAVPGSALDPSTPDPWFAEALRLHDPTVLDLSSGAVPFEQVAAARPDLVLAGTYFGIDEVYDDITAIAPTVAYETGYYQDPWQYQVRLIARALGREPDADRVVTGVERKVAEVRAAHPDWDGKTFAFAFHYDAGSIQVINDPDDPVAQLFLDLGLVLAPGSRALPTQGGGVGASIGLEQVASLDADVLVMLYADETLRASLESNPLFAAVGAVAEGRSTVIDFELAVALRSPTPLSIPFALERIEGHLVEALGPA